MPIGVDLEQFVRDPYGSGIQRVLQQLARWWPTDVQAKFFVPRNDELLSISPSQAIELLDIPFERGLSGSELREALWSHLGSIDAPALTEQEITEKFDAWLLPEVSYLPGVLQRFRVMQNVMPTAMIGYDALPMTNPENYRFKPGTSAEVSEYFLQLVRCDAVVCISEYSREVIRTRLHRSPTKITTVAHPGGDHLEVRARTSRRGQRKKFLRVGTMEARKRPQEILAAFTTACEAGAFAELIFVGGASASDACINESIETAIEQGLPVRWIRGATDSQVYDLMAESDFFLSIGVEGYGIPVLEAIRLGTPVLYAGIQPAGEIMQGRGALDLGPEENLVNAFIQYSDAANSDITVDSAAVPTWIDFASAVAHECDQLRQPRNVVVPVSL